MGDCSIAMYEMALFALSHSLTASELPSCEHLNRLCELCPLLPGFSPLNSGSENFVSLSAFNSSVFNTSLTTAYNMNATNDESLTLGTFPLDSRSQSAMLALLSLLSSPLSSLIFDFTLPYVRSLHFLKAANASFVTAFLRMLVTAHLEAHHIVSLLDAVAYELMELLTRGDDKNAITVASGIAAALSACGLGFTAKLISEPLYNCLILSFMRTCELTSTRSRVTNRTEQQALKTSYTIWLSFQANTIQALGTQISDGVLPSESLEVLFCIALQEIGFRRSTIGEISAMFLRLRHQLPPSVHYKAPQLSFEMLQACLFLLVKCATVNRMLVPVVLQCQVRLLQSSLSGHSIDTSIVSNSVRVFSAVLLAMTTLVRSEISFTTVAVDHLRHLLQDKILTNHSDHDLLHEEISSSIALILRAELEFGGRNFSDTVARNIIFSLDNSLHREPLSHSHQGQCHAEQSALLLLCRLTAMVNHSKVTEHVLPLLVNRFTNSSKLLHIVMPHITDIALVSEDRIFNSIVSLITNIYSKPFLPDNKYNRKEIPDALLYLAVHLSSDHRRHALLKALLKLFKGLARQIEEHVHENAVASFSSLAGVLGLLLPSIAILMQPFDNGPITDIHEEALKVSDFKDSSLHKQSINSTLYNRSQIPQPLRLYDSVQTDVKWFRPIWNYLVLFKFADLSDSSWPPSWRQGVRRIAAHSPCLTTRLYAGVTQTLESSADSNFALMQNSLIDLRTRLLALFPEHSALIMPLSMNSIMYVLAVHSLESLRVSWGSFKQIFPYLEHKTVSPFSRLINAVADKVFDVYIKIIKTWKADTPQRLNLEGHTLFLLAKSCSRFVSIRSKSLEYLRILVSSFPFLQWNKTCFSGLLDLIQIVYKVSDSLDACASSNYLDKTSFFFVCLAENERCEPVLLDLPEDLCQRRDIFISLQKLGSRWLENSLFRVPSQIVSVLQFYVYHVQKNNSLPTALVDHAGIALALRSVSTPRKITRLDLGMLYSSNTSAGNDSEISTFLDFLCLRQRYLGEIGGAFRSFCRKRHANKGNLTEESFFGAFQSQELLIDFQAILARYRRLQLQQRNYRLSESGDKADAVHAEFERCMFMAAALLVWAAQSTGNDNFMAFNIESRHRDINYRELMHLLCMAPVYVFSAITMETAVRAWSWLFSVSHSLAIGVLITMKSSWAYAVENGLGIFSGTSASERSSQSQFDGCLFTVLGTSSVDIAETLLDGMKAHDIWVKFLLERIDTLDERSICCLRVVESMLHKALTRPDRLTVAPASFGVRFRLLYLGLRMVQLSSQHGQTIREDIELLRDRVFVAAFAWFDEAPRWNVHTSIVEVEQDASTIVSFIQAVRAEPSSNSDCDAYSLSEYPSSLQAKNTASIARIPTTSASVGSIASTLRSFPVATGSISSIQRSHRCSAKDSTWIQTRSIAQINLHSVQVAKNRYKTRSKPNDQTNSFSSANLKPGFSTFIAPYPFETCLSGDRIGVSGYDRGVLLHPSPEQSTLVISKSLSQSIKYQATRNESRASLHLLSQHRSLLVQLLSHEYHRLVAWHNPRRNLEVSLRDEKLFAHNPNIISANDWRLLFDTAWSISPVMCYRMAQRFPWVGVLRQLLRTKIMIEPEPFYRLGEAVLLLATAKNVHKNISQLKKLLYFESCSLPTALHLLQRPFCFNRIVTQYALRSLRRHAHTGVIFFMAQIMQALRVDQFGLLHKFLLDAGTVSPYLAHQLIWACQTESVTDESAKRGSGLRSSDDPLPKICQALQAEVISRFSGDSKEFFNAEFCFVGEITKLSVELLTIPKAHKDERKWELRRRLQQIKRNILTQATQKLYLPIDPSTVVVDIICESAIPLQSAARVPFLVDFIVRKNCETQLHETSVCENVAVCLNQLDGSTKVNESSSKAGLATRKPTIMADLTKKVIFKAGDDCRQDALALQVIRLAKDILASVGLPLYLFPYLVIPNRTGVDQDLGGVIECVRNARSRDEIGKVNGLSLRDYFIAKFGRVDGAVYKEAQRNFVQSMAGYAIVCYILQVKDRHNGNILVDDEGHLVHIDFGFLFDISPGNDMRFESAGFKLTVEMVEVMDFWDSKMWRWFVELCARGYLAVRTHHHDFISIVELMMDSALGCFKADSIRNLKARFVPEKNERDAAQHMVNVVNDAYNKWSTTAYDVIQYSQQGIYYYNGSVE